MTIHGFTNHVEALKALAWVVGLIAAGIYGVADTRYAPKSVEAIAVQTWETATVVEIESLVTRLCKPDLPGDYRSELRRRLARLVQQYQNVKNSSPYVPDCDAAAAASAPTPVSQE